MQLNDIELPKTRSVDTEFLRDLELVSNKIFPLPGATFSRNNYADPRLKLQAMPGVEYSDKITLYEHIATVRHSKKDIIYVAFRQTMDALFFEQRDKDKFPDWLMQSQVKLTELAVYIYEVKMINGLHIFPKTLASLTSHEDWLKQIEDNKIFETVAFFLLRNDAISIKMFEKM